MGDLTATPHIGAGGVTRLLPRDGGLGAGRTNFSTPHREYIDARSKILYVSVDVKMKSLTNLSLEAIIP